MWNLNSSTNLVFYPHLNYYNASMQKKFLIGMLIVCWWHACMLLASVVVSIFNQFALLYMQACKNYCYT